MFEFLFNYPLSAFEKGELVLLSGWPLWVLAALIVGFAAGLGWWIWKRHSSFAPGMARWRPVAIWAMEAALVGLILLLLWQPALRIAALKPQQNIVAVVVDGSKSMQFAANGETRLDQAMGLLAGGLLDELSGQFQVRLYRMGAKLERVKSLEGMAAAEQSTRISDSLRQLVAESSSLPIGAVVLLTDGADNAGGIEAEAIGEIRGRRIPVHTIGFGRERFARDVEIVDVQTPDRALAGSRLLARISLRQSGYDERTARVTIRESGKVLASTEVQFAAAGRQQSVPILFNAGEAGAKRIEVSVDAFSDEENPDNNTVAKLVNVGESPRRVLYMEGEPRWEFKFLRRAIVKDPSVKLVSILRTTQNKIYRQGIDDPKQLENGFPARVDDLFGYEGLILGSVEAGYFTPAQQELIREFVDRRGGGVLFLGGRAALADGGYRASTLATLLPVTLPAGKGTFHRDRAGVSLTQAGRDSLITRLVDDPAANVERWKKLPQLADYQQAGEPKPGATVLAELSAPGGRKLPLLITQNYGHGRTAIFATGGSWRWQMQQKLEDQTHEMFWQQVVRWLVNGAPGRVTLSVPSQVLFDDSRVELTAVVRDKTYAPVSDARVEARILEPGGAESRVELNPDPREAGVYHAAWSASSPGSFVAEVQAFRGEEDAGKDMITFARMDGIAESFRAEQNRELLEKLSEQTGGRYYTPATAGKLADEISFSEAGITVRETRDLWNMPAVFLLLLLLKAAEWFLRRKWGVV